MSPATKTWDKPDAYRQSARYSRHKTTLVPVGIPEQYGARHERPRICTDEFWQRYYTDPWVFNLANAVERLTQRVAELERGETWR